MDDQAALLLAWLEGEGERQRRPLAPLPQGKDSPPRGWIQIGVCVLGGTLAAALFVCWLTTAREKAARASCMENLRRGAILGMTGDPNRPAWWDGKGVTETITVGTNAGANVGAFVVFLLVRVFAIVLATAIGVVLLRAACIFHNKLVGGRASPNSVPEPLFGKAISIAFVTTLVNVVAESAIKFLVGAGDAAFAQLLFLPPTNLLVMAGMNRAMLPTTFAQGFLVALCYLLAAFVLGVVLVALFAGLFVVVFLLS